MHTIPWCRAHFLLLVAVTGLSSPGCGTTDPDAPPPGRAVYFDRETKQPLVADVADAFPAVHPQTGRRTLLPALYCTSCRQWHPVPAPDQINRTPGGAVCRKSGTALTSEGPWPES